MFLAVGSLGVTHEEARLRETERLARGWKERRRRWSGSGRERERASLQKKEKREGTELDNTRFGAEATTGRPTADRLTDRKRQLCQSPLNWLVHDVAHIMTRGQPRCYIPPVLCVSVCDERLTVCSWQLSVSVAVVVSVKTIPKCQPCARDCGLHA